MDRQTESYIENREVWVDAVSHEPVDPKQSKHRSFYAGHMYHFATLINKQTFDQDPQLWVSTAHASPNAGNIDPTEDEG